VYVDGVVSYTDIRFDEEGDDVGDMGAFKHNFCFFFKYNFLVADLDKYVCILNICLYFHGETMGRFLFGLVFQKG